MFKDDDLIITSFETVTAFTLTGSFWFSLDELQNISIANSEDSEEITGRNGRRIGALKKNKSVTITGTSGVVSGGLMEAQTGGAFKKVVTTIMWTDHLVIEGNQARTTWKATGTNGNEISKVYVKNENGLVETELTQNSYTSETTFTYDPSTKIIEFREDDWKDGTEITVYYQRKILSSLLSNHSDAHAGKCQLYVDAFAENGYGDIFRVQFYIPVADFKGDFELTLGGSQTTHEFEAVALPSSCLGKNNLWTYTVYRTHYRKKITGDGIEMYIEAGDDVETTCYRYWSLGDMDPYDLGDLDEIYLDDMVDIY